MQKIKNKNKSDLITKGRVKNFKTLKINFKKIIGD